MSVLIPRLKSPRIGWWRILVKLNAKNYFIWILLKINRCCRFSIKMRAHLRLMWNQASDTVLKLIKLLKWFEPSLGWWPHGRTKIKIRKKERSHAAYFSFTVSIRSICWEILPSNFVTVLFIAIVFATFVFHFEDNDNFFPLSTEVFIEYFFCN